MKEPIIPCDKDADLATKVEQLKDAIRTKAHTLVDFQMPDEQFREGVLRSALESLRGSNSADMSAKRAFVAAILDDMRARAFIRDWRGSGSSNRFDYSIELKSGRTCIIELKGCLDGNNTNIFERPTQADEFVIWSVCQNAASDPRKNVWSGVHTRLSSEIFSREVVVDGLIVWDLLCGTVRNCPKLAVAPDRKLTVGKYSLPPPCVYLLPAQVPAVRNNRQPRVHQIEDVEFLSALCDCYGVQSDEIYSVSFEVSVKGAETMRMTKIIQMETLIKQSAGTAIKRK